MGEIAKVIEATEKRFTEMAPSYMKYDAEKGFAIQLLNNNSYLMKAAQESPTSLQQAITNVAAIGLSLNPAEKLAYLIPRNVKVSKNEWQTRVFLEPSYVGLIRLATDSGSILWVQAYPVYANDEFTDNGAGEKPTHKYDAFAKLEDRGEFKGVYCVAKTNTDDYLTTIMPAEKVYDIRGRSEQYKKYQSGVWVTDFVEMAKKAVIRTAFKTWPRTDDKKLANAIHLSNENEGFEPILTSPSLGEYTAEQKKYFDQMIEDGDAEGMFAFSKTIERNTFTSLYHSFEKGMKGKYQKIIDQLVYEGGEKFQEIIANVESVCSSGDELGLVEIMEELSKDDQLMIKESITQESLIFINEQHDKGNL